MQIRSHRAVAIEYLDRRVDALREHRRVANYEQRTGDLRGYAKSLNNIGIVHMNQRQWKPAIAAFEQSWALNPTSATPRHRPIAAQPRQAPLPARSPPLGRESAFLKSLRLRLGRARDDHGAAQSYIALAHVALKPGKLEDAEQYATLALEAHVACGDQRGVTLARGVLRMTVAVVAADASSEATR